VKLLLLTNDPHAESVLPALALLTHSVRCAPSEEPHPGAAGIRTGDQLTKRPGRATLR
jgi:hypothetical protein